MSERTISLDKPNAARLTYSAQYNAAQSKSEQQNTALSDLLDFIRKKTEIERECYTKMAKLADSYVQKCTKHI